MKSIAHRLKLACDALCTILKAEAPYDTGNLALDGIRVIEGEPGYFYVAVGGEIAPYAKYTQESWDNFDAPLKGKKNPNEGWINRGIEKALPLIKQIMEGAITEDEANEYLESRGYTRELKEKQIKRAEYLEAKARKLVS